MNKHKISIRSLASLILGAVTFALIGLCATKLPYSHVLVAITDALSIPAAVISGFFFPAGVHTGNGAPSWGTVFFLSGVLFYTLLWFGILTWAEFMKRQRAADRNTLRS